MQITLVLHNIRSTYNVGAILRTAEGLGINQVVYSGYTPRYNNPNLLPHLRDKLNHQIAKSAIGAEKLVPQKSIDNLTNWLAEKRAEGNVIFGLENNLSLSEKSRQILLNDLKDKLLDLDTKKLVLILGEEVAGIPLKIREECDYFLEIPMRGRKESFNVSIASAIALWELSRH